jgi:hypothetical protein
MNPLLLKARRYGNFTIRGAIYMQSLVSKYDLAMALRNLKSDARKAARAAMDYLDSGGHVDERPTLAERERTLGLIRAQVAQVVRKLRRGHQALAELDLEDVVAEPSQEESVPGAAGSAAGRPLFGVHDPKRSNGSRS